MVEVSFTFEASMEYTPLLILINQILYFLNIFIDFFSYFWEPILPIECYKVVYQIDFFQKIYERYHKHFC